LDLRHLAVSMLIPGTRAFLGTGLGEPDIAAPGCRHRVSGRIGRLVAAQSIAI